MELCGIEKYDKLPSIVGDLDINSQRFRLSVIDIERKRITELLDEAHKEHSFTLNHTIKEYK